MKKAFGIVICVVLAIEIVFSVITLVTNGLDLWDWIVLINSIIFLLFELYDLIKQPRCDNTKTKEPDEK